MKTCIICGKELNERQKKTCGVVCQGKHRTNWMKGKTGKACWNWKGGKILVQGRVYIYAPGHPNARLNKNYISRARLVMSKKVGRALLPNEHVHHINGIKTDDNPRNLVILTNQGHKKLHAKDIAEITKRKFRISAQKRGRNSHGQFT